MDQKHCLLGGRVVFVSPRNADTLKVSRIAEHSTDLILLSSISPWNWDKRVAS